MKYFLISLCALFFFFTACNKNNAETPSANTDYRLQYIGTYDCTKSNASFEDNMFTTDIEVVVKIDSIMDSLIIINDIKLPLKLDGSFGLEEYEGASYELDFTKDKIRLATYRIFPEGIALPCFIQGEKR